MNGIIFALALTLINPMMNTYTTEGYYSNGIYTTENGNQFAFVISKDDITDTEGHKCRLHNNIYATVTFSNNGTPDDVTDDVPIINNGIKVDVVATIIQREKKALSTIKGYKVKKLDKYNLRIEEE